MKIALLNPPSPFLTNERVFPNMGLVRLATKLKEEGHKVDLHDYAGKSTDPVINLGYYDLYGFSSTSPQMPETMNMFTKLMMTHPGARTVLGGPHASALYQMRQKGIQDSNIQDLEVFDTVFAGEGENTENIFKTGWQKGEIIRHLDDVPVPDRSLIDLPSYNYDLNGKKTTSIQSQRGCPNQCGFCCGRDIEMYNKVRHHSPERVVRELDELHDKYGFNSFMWYDDEVNINPARLEELCGRLAKRDYQHRGFVTSDMIVKYPGTVNMMKGAGFVKLCTGVESGSDKILGLIGKRADSETNYEARRIIGDRGLHYEAFTIIGFPQETRGDVNKTIEWLKTAKPDDYDINVLTPYPGSKIYNEATPSDRYKGYDWEYKGLYFNKPNYSSDPSFYKGIGGKSASNVRTDSMTSKFINKMRDKIEAMKRK